MDGVARILHRYIGTTIVIAVFLLILNFIFLGTWFFAGMNEGLPPASIAQHVTEGLTISESRFSLEPAAEKLLRQNYAWAMLLDAQGQIAWSYSLPSELSHSYSLVEVAQFSRNYLQDYPVYVWEHKQGLVVVGFPKDSVAKYQFVFPIEWISNLPYRFLALLAGNAVLALLVALLIGSRFVKSIRPLVRGIHALADEQQAYVEPKGVLSSLAKSMNQTSTLLQQKNEQLKARDEARSNWIAGISHDIRTPLSMVLGYASELEESERIPIEEQKKAGIIRKQGEKLRSLVHDLNLVSMLEYDMQPLYTKPLKLSAIARSIATEFLNNGLDDSYTLEVDLSDECIVVNGDEKLLTRAVTNLIQNSITHNPKGCRIVMRTELSADNLFGRIIVTDNGKGYPSDELSDLLELPYSTKRKSPAQNGHGLGLPMVARIAKAHRGQLVLASTIGEGMKAEIVLTL
ncbi:sensor histidine kinase [Brevibacillus reuszeri]|uniref:sensor histidine kinase n=1 Tax=Brevibacillus reuszeri TaxID=54915 RepID=UPI000CCC2FE9|nr:HAMP domain-containing sensor histidine kinase [Brevibacillus reuszeri]